MYSFTSSPDGPKQMTAQRDIILSLSQRSAERYSDPMVQSAIIKTGGVPVYSDLGGVLLIDPEMTVLELDTETGALRVVSDAAWRRVAFSCAARTFPLLAELMPQRPQGAVPCGQCMESGCLLGEVTCGKCHGLGWLDPSLRTRA